MEPAPYVRVLVLARSPAARMGIAALLGTDSTIDVVASAHPDDGFEGTDAAGVVIVGELPHDEPALADAPAVLVGTTAGDFASIALRPGLALLLDSAESEEISAAVHAVAQGLVVLDPTIAFERERAPAPERPTGVDPLSDREREVLLLLADGLPNKAIAYRLGISEHTAKFHVSSILAKLGAASRTEAVTLAARTGLLPL